jgi:hypothetical protein
MEQEMEPKQAVYKHPIGFRPDDDDLKAIEKVIAQHSKPGLKINRSDALKIALHEYASSLPETPVLSKG